MASTKAQIAKDKGNNAFKAGNWAEAIGHYSEAVIADRTNPTLPLNRAAAYLKLSKFQDADRDCTTVLSLDPNNVKAFFRRAQARSALARYSEAEKDLSHALKLEPANDSIKSELSSVRNKIAQAEKEKKSKSKQAASLPPPPPPTKRRVVRNVPIEIVEPEEETTPTNGETTSNTPQPISPSPSPSSSSQRTPPELLTKVQSRLLSPSQDTPARSVPSGSTSTSKSTSTPTSASASPLPSSSQIPSPPPSQATSPNPTPIPKPRVGAAIFRANGSYTILRSPDPPTPTPPTSTSASASSAAVSTPVLIPQEIPQTHFAFARRWNNLTTSQERLSLIQLIPPESLPTLFKNNLAPELLISILKTFLEISSTSPESNALILSYMSTIPNIPRFDTVLLFFSAKEREIVASLWDNIDPDKTNEYRVLWGAK